jgi:4'-phosphopantetheinyl transferase
MTPTLDPLDVHLRYRLIDSTPGDSYAGALAMLSSDEQARAARFVFLRDRVTFVAAHALLRQALSEYADVAPGAWIFEQAAHGKPRLGGRLAATGLRFNLAHTHGLVACVVARGAELGVDVESIRPGPAALDIAARFFSPGETAHLHECAGPERPARFIELWTLKEAYVKGTGEGLAHPLHTFSFQFEGPSSLRFEPPPVVGGATDPPLDWQFALFAPSAEQRMAVAIGCPCGQARRIRAWTDAADAPQPALLRASAVTAAASRS